MDLIENKQTRLIIIKNLCISFSIIVEKLYDTPDAAELLEFIMKLAKECEEYLRICLI